MGGGDLNMKKSWHPLLHVNQERVWKKEKEALEERKKMDELRKERQQEREMQELQRLQEEAGGKKRQDRVDWMYATPALHSGPSDGEMEDYLLGKKRVDQILRSDEAAKVSKHDQGTFISLQHANTSKDTAAKLREDPMLAIKQQEQAAYQALLRDPTRLRQMRQRAGLEVEERASKDERCRRRTEKRQLRESRHSPRRQDDRRYEKNGQDHDREGGRGGSRDAQRPQASEHDRTSHARRQARDRDDPRRDERRRNDQHTSRYSTRDGGSWRSRSRSPQRPAERERGIESARPRPRSGDNASCHLGRSELASDARREETDAVRMAKVHEMMTNARSLEASRTSLIEQANNEEAIEAAQEEHLRERTSSAQRKGAGDGRGSFLLDQQRQVVADHVDLGERLRRGRGGYQRID